jgi:hypothetical protein
MVAAPLTQIAAPSEPVFLEKHANSPDIAWDGESIA